MHYKRPALDLNEFENATYRCSQKVCTNTPRCAKTTARFHREKSALFEDAIVKNRHVLLTTVALTNALRSLMLKKRRSGS
jgi:hypothetical protein